MPENGVFPIEVLDPIREGDEELAAASRRISWRYSHGDRALRYVLELVTDLRRKVPGRGRRGRMQSM